MKLVPTFTLLFAAADGYCNWNNCNGQIEGGDWCNANANRCRSGCGGTWCPDSGDSDVWSPTPLPTQATTPTATQCTPADTDMYYVSGDGTKRDCCAGTHECDEPRPADDPYFSQWPRVMMCRADGIACVTDNTSPAATPAPATPDPATPAPPAATPTPPAATAPPTSAAAGYCNWNGCDGRVQGGVWCNADGGQCGTCGGTWCDGAATSPSPSPSSGPAPSPGGDTGSGDTGTGAGGTLAATHFWDCSGAACDATVLQPWDPSNYLYAAQYAPVDPNDYGGPSAHGERLWATGAASDALTAAMGADDGCCGSVSEAPGGCGKCLLVRNPSAVNSDWSAIVMKKNRCPPWSNGCDRPHLDIAVPGFDNLQYSTANICSADPAARTTIDAAQSSSCGSWYNGNADTIAAAGCCSALPTATADQRRLRAGCELFAAWGWTTGNPQLTYEPVACPAAFTRVVGGAFNAGGPVVDSSTRWLRGF